MLPSYVLDYFLFLRQTQELNGALGILLCALQINWKKNFEEFVSSVIPPDKVTDGIVEDVLELE